ncbi:L-threonine ammonia-lyase-like [Cydia amplana]|uniref:L-threonine ammonia-lyase-like n=1 Tax=Cydia amplana TaxID=1869771 RepID=UPI002FE5BB29
MERYMYSDVEHLGEDLDCLLQVNKEPVEFDPMCDKENPHKISFEDVSAAAFRIQSGIIKTPCVKSHMSLEYGMDIYLKNDFLQHTGSFKERGARNALVLLPSEARQRGVISASLGNHSQALSYHANLLNIPATVVMPNVAPIMKIQKCRSFGANVVIHGHDMREAKHQAMVLAKERNLTYINGYDHPHIMAGQGTVGLEIVEQVPDVDAVLVPVGGGGLLAGTATAIKHLKPHVLIYGVESEKCASMTEALNNGQPENVHIRSTLADGLAVPTVGYNAYHTSKSLVDRVISLPEDWIARAILLLVEQEKFVVEGGGAVGIAAIMAGLVPELAGKKVVCILSGGNIDTTILGRCLERGLAAESRLVKFKVTVSDRPGGIAELCKVISSTGVSIKDIMQERAWVCGDIFSVRVKVVCETRGPEHTDELRSLIARTYREWVFTREAGDYCHTPLKNYDSLDNVSH